MADPQGHSAAFVTTDAPHRDNASGTWICDGVAGIPDAVMARLTEAGQDFRLATFGKVLRCFVHDFGDSVGRHTVCICEKGALVYFGDYQAPYDVQGISLSLLPGVLADPG